MPGDADVVVLGGGPAGRALAGACAARGLRTTLVDPAPGRAWRATYGAWVAELPADLPAAVIGSRSRALGVGTTTHALDGAYAVLDTGALRAHLDTGLTGVRALADRATDIGPPAPAPGRQVVHLSDGGTLTTGVVVDATGAPSALRPARAGQAAEQTAYGVVVPAALAEPWVRPGEAMFMDWRPAVVDGSCRAGPNDRVGGPMPTDGAPGQAGGARPDEGGHGPAWPTFLYAVPYGDGTVLLEETSLARRPGLPLSELRIRLHARLRRHGVEVPGGAAVEKVRFPVDEPRAGAHPTAFGPTTPHLHPIAFGAATPLVHPASGFSVAAALTLAPAVADAVAAHLPRDAAAAGAAAAGVLWPVGARIVHRLRRHGLRTILTLSPELVPQFFEAFFRLPDTHRRAFLSGRAEPAATVRAMAALAATANGPVRTHLLRSAVPTSALDHLPE